MIPLVMLLLSAATDPPKKLTPIFTREDYPLEAIRRGEQGEVVVDLLVNPSGGVETCNVALSSGFQVLDDATCTLLRNRARFTPAKDDAGHPMYAVVRSPPVTWSLGSFRTSAVPPDYDLVINQAPDGVKLPVEFGVDFLLTREGKSQNCVPAGDKSAPAVLVTLACRAVASEPAHMIRDRNGVPVEAQDHASFRFSVETPKRK